MVVDKMFPYVTNPIKDTIGRTRNIQDSLNIFADAHGPEGQYNPVFKVHMLGGVVSQGLVAYITMVRSQIPGKILAFSNSQNYRA